MHRDKVSLELSLMGSLSLPRSTFQAQVEQEASLDDQSNMTEFHTATQ